MATTDMTILDHVDNLQVPGRVFEQPVNEYWALVCLRSGLDFLYRQAAYCDKAATELLEAPPGTCIDVFGNDPAFAALPMPLLTSVFHWYAVSACQYVRTVGTIVWRLDPGRKKPDEYLASVIPDVLMFRNKIAAHFSWTMNHSRDNDAERAYSVMPPLSFVRGSFRVGALSLFMRRGNEAASTASITPWSICETHSELRKRYWPEQTPEQLESS